MSKQIVIVGGGISGLSCLHYLKKKYSHRSDLNITLLEKNSFNGGTIRTFAQDGYRFEGGPNGFLTSNPSTLELAKDLGLESELLVANESAKERYICVKGQLHKLPLNPVSFLFFQPLSVASKLRIVGELFVAKGHDPKETVYDFGKRRIGENFSKLFLDPMVSGVYGGDANQLCLKMTFPRIYDLEQAHGSLIKAAVHIARTKKREKKERAAIGQPTGKLTSFKNGMGQLIETLAKRYMDSIRLSEDVTVITKENGQFHVKTDCQEYICDAVVICAPAYHTAKMLMALDGGLSRELQKIYYASMAVVGLGYKGDDIKTKIDGFGYLIPSSEQKKILGVLFSSCIFQNRSDEKHCLFQVMIGGTRYPEVVQMPKEELITLAKKELEETLGITAQPQKEFTLLWPQGIPQYHRDHEEILAAIDKRTGKFPGLLLASNYKGGISLNDCIANAKRLAEQSDF